MTRDNKTAAPKTTSEPISPVAAFGLALLAGIAAGALAGLAYAPRKGEETRKNLSKYKEQGAQSVQFVWDVSKEKASFARGTAISRWDRLIRALDAGIEEAKRVRAEIESKRNA